jgi:hypothetical protein
MVKTFLHRGSENLLTFTEIRHAKISKRLDRLQHKKAVRIGLSWQYTMRILLALTGLALASGYIIFNYNYTENSKFSNG